MINDANYPVNPKIGPRRRRMCPYYRVWMNMRSLCYNPKVQARNPSYIGCTVCAEWHSFMAFRRWMMRQDWKGKVLTKGFLNPENRVYGPEFCAFVDPEQGYANAGKAYV